MESTNMAENIVELLTDVADAIREKKGSTEKIKAQNFAEEIKNLPSGGNVAVFAENMVDNTGLGKSAVKKLLISSGVEIIETQAYQSMPFEDVDMPLSVTKIKSRAFMATNLKEVLIPSNVFQIDTSCFENCKMLEKVFVMGSLSFIGVDAFWGCTEMQELHLESSSAIPTLASSTVFKNNPCKIIVPDALYDSWIVATNWNVVADQIIKASEYESQNG